MTPPKKKILVSVAIIHHKEKFRHQMICGNYVDWLKPGLKGVEIMPIDSSMLKKLSKLIDETVAVVFTGGVDIDPKLYGETPGNHTHTPNTPRDVFESKLFDLAHARKLPILGICRGMQFVNVKLGGKLKQHIGDTHTRDEKRKDRIHKVKLRKDSRFAALFKSDVIEVNSAHHQSVDPKHLGKGLKVA